MFSVCFVLSSASGVNNLICICYEDESGETCKKVQPLKKNLYIHMIRKEQTEGNTICVAALASFFDQGKEVNHMVIVYPRLHG